MNLPLTRLKERYQRLTEAQFALVVTVGFAILLVFALSRHVLYRDEFQAWMIARDSPNLATLWNTYRYESHPGVWYLLLFLASRFTRDPSAMAALHGAIAVAVVYVWMRYAPLSRGVRVAFAFSYYPLYQHGLILRSYGLGNLLFFCYLAVLSRKRGDWGWMAFLLAVMANVNACSLVLAGGLWLVTLVVHFSEMRKEARLAKAFTLYSLIAFCAMAFSAYQIVPPRDFYTARPGSDSRHLFVQSRIPRNRVLMNAVWSGYTVTKPPIFMQWIPKRTPLSKLRPLLVWIPLLWFLLGWLSLRGSRVGRLFFVVSNGLFCTLFALTLYTSSRQTGYFLILFLGSLWLARVFPNAQEEPLRWAFLRREGLALGVLCLQMWIGLWHYARDLRVPVSAARDAVAFLQNSPYRDLPVIAYPDMSGGTIAGYLDRPVYYQTQQQFGTYAVWQKRTHFLSLEKGFEEAMEWAKQYPEGAIWVVGVGQASRLSPGDAKLLGVFEKAWYERFALFLLPPKGSRRTP